jgi:VIT1/CCC1 family predicted Fe2+/Mn2+ transporter
LSQRITDMAIAEAIRDLQTVRSLDFMTPGEKDELHELTAYYLKTTAASNFADVDAFETENYRRLQPTKHAVIFDGVREVLRTYLPTQISWSPEEKVTRKELYEKGIYKPEILSSTADRLARFIVGAGGALFILVPMYIMSLHQNLMNSLVTTTIAVVLFVLVCSIPLKLANDQIFSSTFGYAAVLMVFVGLTSSPQQ